MNGYELIIPHLIADRHQRSDADRLAKAALQPQPGADEAESVKDARAFYQPAPWMPVLRGYPYDPEFGR